MQHRLLIFLALAWLAWILPEQGSFAGNTGPRPSVSVPQTVLRPLLTADPADPAWKTARVIPALTVSLGPDGQGKTPLMTQVKLLWDQDNLYIRFVCGATEVYSPFSQHDDPLYQGDVVEVFLDAKGDSRQWVELEVSPKNVILDQVTTLTTEPRSRPDLILTTEALERDWWDNLSWSLTGLQTAATIQEKNGKASSWIVDMALPAKAVLRRQGISRFAPMALRANFLRYEYPGTGDITAPRHLLAMNWAPVIYGCPHISPQAMGYITLKK